jgi:hypothetical protein
MLRRSNDTSVSGKGSTAAIEGLESRQLMAATASVIAVKVAKRVDADGNALDSNRITIGFTQNITLNNAALLRNFGYANDMLTSSSQRKVTVNLSATASANVLTIITDRLVRKGSKLQILTGAITDAGGHDLAQNVTFTVGQNKPRFTMSSRAWRATDKSYFESDVISGAPSATVLNTQPSATTVRANLVTFLNKKVSAKLITQAQETSALATYDSATTAGYIPSANLRAALVSLVGTVAEPAINSMLGKANVTGKGWTSISFGNSSQISASAPTAETKLSSSGRLSTVVRDTLQGESFAALSAILARECMHQGTTANSNGNTPDSQDAEVIDNAVANVVYAQQLLVDPSVAGAGSTLTTYLNTQLLALLNSGQKLFPYGGINPAATVNGIASNVFVGGVADPGGFGNSTPVTSFTDFVKRDFTHRGLANPTIATSPYAQTVLKNIVGKSGTFTQFNSTVQTYLDTRNQVLTDVAYIKLGQALKLTF